MPQVTQFQIEQVRKDEPSLPVWSATEILQTRIRLTEGARYRFTLTSTHEEVGLVIGEESVNPIRVYQSEESTKLTWIYSPDFYAGEVDVQLFADGCCLFSQRADVSPNTTKLGHAYYREILEDLETKSSTCLYGGKAGGIRIKRSGEKHPPMAFMAILAGRIESIERAFASVAKAPHRTLVSNRHEAKLHQVRRIDAVTVRSTARRPSLVASIRGIEGSSRQETINVPRREHTFDTAPNRIALGHIQALVRRCQELRSILQLQTNADDPGEVDATKKQRWAVRLSELESRVALLSRAPFLKGLKPRAESSGAYIAVTRHPAYNRFCRIAREIFNPVTKLAVESDQLLTLKSTFQLYEYWTFFAVVEEFRKQYPTFIWTNQFGLTENELFHTLKSDSVAVGTNGDRIIHVAFQQNYDRDIPYSVSRACRPDIIVEVRDPSWPRPRLILLDAKYRSMPGSIQSGIDDMHVYRDSIRYSPTEPAVSAAFILTPRKLKLPIYDPAFHAKHRIGAIQASPGDISGLAHVIDFALRKVGD